MAIDPPAWSIRTRERGPGLHRAMRPSNLATIAERASEEARELTAASQDGMRARLTANVAAAVASSQQFPGIASLRRQIDEPPSACATPIDRFVPPEPVVAEQGYFGFASWQSAAPSAAPAPPTAATAVASPPRAASLAAAPTLSPIGMSAADAFGALAQRPADGREPRADAHRSRNAYRSTARLLFTYLVQPAIVAVELGFATLGVVVGTLKAIFDVLQGLWSALGAAFQRLNTMAPPAPEPAPAATSAQVPALTAAATAAAAAVATDERSATPPPAPTHVDADDSPPPQGAHLSDDSESDGEHKADDVIGSDDEGCLVGAARSEASAADAHTDDEEEPGSPAQAQSAAASPDEADEADDAWSPHGTRPGSAMSRAGSPVETPA